MQIKQMSKKHLVTSREVAELLDCSITSVNRHVQAGELKAFTKAPGKRGAYLFTTEDVMAFKASRAGEKVKAGSSEGAGK